MGIRENLAQIFTEIPEQVSLVAVSKTKPVDALKDAYEGGQRIFGENKVQELIEKHTQLPDDVQWHMIGHLQRNKVKYIAPFISLIHSVDSLRLLNEINKQGSKLNLKINCLLQIHIAQEEHKFGLSANELDEILSSSDAFDFVNIKGLMGMASFTDNQDQLKSEFTYLAQLFKEKAIDFKNLEILSMGMSGDYQLAIDCGSNMIRVGSRIFGARNYHH